MCWHSCGFSPAGRTSGSERERKREREGEGGGAEEPSTTNSLKHTTDIKDGENHSEIERRSGGKTRIRGGMKAEKDVMGGEKVPASVSGMRGKIKCQTQTEITFL